MKDTGNYNSIMPIFFRAMVRFEPERFPDLSNKAGIIEPEIRNQ